MAFKTAVFYDIENLLKGYSFSQQLIMNLSLKEILQTTKESYNLEGLAVQKAYANWSDPRLAVMRGEINELGIDPVQVFGFSWENKKNAADIQLAIDAIDLAYTRPAIDTFVIVSGDGGFSALAKKLHEYGKTVIGCAYRGATNNVFRAVCDGFVWINDPEPEEDNEDGQRISVASASKSSTWYQVSDPRNIRLTQKVKVATDTGREQVIQKSREVVAWYLADAGSKKDMLRTGIFLSVVQEAMKYAIPDFQQSKLGYLKFVEYMQNICTGTELCVAKPPGSGAVLSIRGEAGKSWEILPDIESQETHSVGNYQAVLAAGIPMFRLPDETVLVAAAKWLSEHGRVKDSFGRLVDRASAALPEISSESIKSAILSFASADVFVREPVLSQISEQVWRLRQEFSDYRLILEQLFISVEQKLKRSIGDFQRSILEEVISMDRVA